MSCLQHHLTNSARQLTVTNLNYSPLVLNTGNLHEENVGTFRLADHESYKRFSE